MNANGKAVDPLDAYKDELRERYTTAIHDVVAELVSDIAAPADQVALLSDMLDFTAFSIVIKVAEIMGADMRDRWELKRVWGKLNTAMEQSLAPTLTEYANAQLFGDQPTV